AVISYDSWMSASSHHFNFLLYSIKLPWSKCNSLNCIIPFIEVMGCFENNTECTDTENFIDIELIVESEKEFRRTRIHWMID
ncbi:hypothetical protein PMAYCL1PPCAC_08952, partial [Pristionchus mayeri]